MPNLQENNAVKFLSAVKFYLCGDLSNFEKLCTQAEEKEKSNFECANGENLICETERIPIGDDTPTTTTQTTSSPNSAYNMNREGIFFRSTLPHVHTVIATADLVGFLLGDLPVKPINNLKNINKFFSTSISETEIMYLTFFYRHGITHTYFPKKGFGIKAHSSNPKNELFFLENETIVLNVNYLIELTKQRLDFVIKDNDSHNNMQTQFSKLEEHDNDKIEKFQPNIEEFKSGLPSI